MFNFGKRRVRVVNYTRQISLPKDWLRFEGLEEGGEVIVELTEEGDLLIKAVKGRVNE